MSTCLDALSDHDVDAGFSRGRRFRHGANLEQDLDSVPVRAFHKRRRVAPEEH